MGVILWHQVSFPDLKLKLSNDVYQGDYLVDAAITVTYGFDQPGMVEIRLKDLPLPVQDRLAGGLTGGNGKDGVKVQVKLGYLDDPSGQDLVFDGRIESLQASTRFPPLGVALEGHEQAAFTLLNTTALNGEQSAPRRAHLPGDRAYTPAEAAAKILGAAHLEAAGTVTPDKPSRNLNVDADDAFAALVEVARGFDAEVLVQDGKVLFGIDLSYPPPGPLAAPPDPAAVLKALSWGDCLVAITGDKGLTSVALAEFRPVQIGSSKSKVTTDRPGQRDVRAFDFMVPGAPALRAGQLVVASVAGYENPFQSFRILTLTHSYSVESGYTCSGRGVAYTKGESNREVSVRARQGSAVSVADRIAGKIKESQAGSPAVDVGRVKAVKPAERVATVQYRTSSSNAVASPSVGLDIPAADSPTLLSKPMAAPFAWHRVGLSVPVYEGMRALLNQVRSSRDDTVLTGYLWSTEPKMEPPPANDGDWWLCLPTKVSGKPPLPDGPAANDLTAANGLRVIETPGLKVVVGKSACTQVGTRPQEGKPDVLVITHSTGTEVSIDDQGNVTVDGKGTVVLKAGGATLTVGNGKVAIS